MDLKVNEQIDKKKLNDQETLLHSLKEENKTFETNNINLVDKIDVLNQNINDLDNTIIIKENEYEIQQRKFIDLEFLVNSLKMQNGALEKNEEDLNETVDLLKQNIKDQLNMHNTELSNKDQELIKITFEFDEFKKEFGNTNNKCMHEIDD
jgi:chromosome segregation ATPase